MTAAEVLRLHGRFHAAPRDADELLRTARPRGGRRRRATGGCRAASGSGCGLALALVGRPELRRPRRADGRDGRRGPGGDASAHRSPTERRDDHPADEPRPGRRRAARRPDRDHRPRPARRGRARPTSCRRRAAALHLRLDALLTAEERELLAAQAGRPITEAAAASTYELDGSSPDPALVAAVAAWCAERGVLIARAAGGRRDRSRSATSSCRRQRTRPVKALRRG